MEDLKVRMSFMDRHCLRLESEDFNKYLNLFSFPCRLRLLLIKRKFSLENEREVLSAEMAKEKDRVLNAIIGYRECFEYFKKVGLYKPGSTLFAFPADKKNADGAKKEVVKNIIKRKVLKDEATDGGSSAR